MKKSELFEKIVARLERKNSSLNDLNQDDSNENDQLPNNNEQLDTSLSLLKRDKFKLLESLYRLDSNVINPNDKEKLFNLIQKRQQMTSQQLIMQHQQQQQQQQQQNSATDNFANQLQTQQPPQKTQFEREQEIDRINRFNYNFSKFDSFSNNMQRPTPDDKRRYFSAMSKNMQHITNSNNNNNLLVNFFLSSLLEFKSN